MPEIQEIHDFAYWMALAHLPRRWKKERINRLIIEIIHSRNLSLAEFFDLSESNWQSEFQLSEKESADLLEAKSQLPDNSLLAQHLLEQGFEIIPIEGSDYSETLKKNLKVKYSPPLLYIMGDKHLLQEPSVAIVGSRDASEISLQFTDSVAKKCVEDHKIVVSGFAKGVDRKALESTLQYYGRSIIVLPQGIMTFASGLRKYSDRIADGDVLVLSTYPPNVPWNAGFAMGRNTYIYGLADEIYVAESGSKGGTWSGVIDGLRKDRLIFVREAGSDEDNANSLLISKGAIPVDAGGNVIGKLEDHIKAEEPKPDQLEMDLGGSGK
jgi:DNA processing protein